MTPPKSRPRPTRSSKKKPKARTEARSGRKPARRTATRPTSSRKATGPDAPQMFRLNLEVADVERAALFYQQLLGVQGRRQAGARVYFACGAVTLQVVDVSRGGAPHPAAKALYFSVANLDAVFVRARELGCLSTDDVHGEAGGEISVRPWGERSFYAEDPWRNPLCFVERGTEYTG